MFICTFLMFYQQKLGLSWLNFWIKVLRLRNHCSNRNFMAFIWLLSSGFCTGFMNMLTKYRRPYSFCSHKFLGEARWAFCLRGSLSTDLVLFCKNPVLWTWRQAQYSHWLSRTHTFLAFGYLDFWFLKKHLVCFYSGFEWDHFKFFNMEWRRKMCF